MATLLWAGGGSFAFSMFKWFFSATGEKCGGWDQFPTFGLKALKWKWQYDWSLTYIGVGKLHWLSLPAHNGASLKSICTWNMCICCATDIHLGLLLWEVWYCQCSHDQTLQAQGASLHRGCLLRLSVVGSSVGSMCRHDLPAHCECVHDVGIHPVMGYPVAVH